MTLLLWLASLASAETRLTVAETMSLAVERNPDVRSAELALAIASISASRARLDRYTALVSVNGGLDLGITKPWDEPSVTNSAATWNAGATVGVPLYSGGRVDALIDRAEAGSAIASLERELTEREVVRAAYTAYWNIKGFELQIRAAEEGLAATQEALDIIRAKADAGLVAGIDVNRSTVDLYSQQDGLIAQQSALLQSRQDLVRLLRLDDEDLVLVDEPALASAGAVVLPADAGVERPERARQALTADQAEADVRIARSTALPTVALTGTAGASAAALGQDPDTVTIGGVVVPSVVDFDAADLGRPQLDAGVGLALTWNPFDLFRTRDAVRQAKLAADQVESRNTAENDRIAADLRSAAVRLQALRDRAPLVEQQVGLARDNLAIVQDLYSQGSATILDLFNAQSSFRQALVLQAGLAVDLSTSELDLRWLLGEDVASGARP